MKSPHHHVAAARQTVTRLLATCFTLLLAAASSVAGTPGAGPYRVVQDDATGVYWFEDVAGGRFLSIGVNHIVEAHDYQPPPGSTYYRAVEEVFGGDHDAWRASVHDLLDGSGFNTIGAWSSPRVNDGTLLETPILYTAGHAKERVLMGLTPGFDEAARQNLHLAIDPIEHPDRILGVFLDNEMAWYGASPWDNNPRYTILELAFTLPASDPCRVAVVDFLKDRHETVEAFAKAWGIEPTSWEAVTADALRSSSTEAAMSDRADLIEKAAEAFFARSVAVVRAEMPGTMILGTRFAGDAPDAVIRAAGRHCDVVSYNNYRARPEIDARLAARYWLLSQKPLMITEFAWRGRENTSGNPNSGGAGSVLQTQAERGDAYAGFVRDGLAWPMIVGMHWFEFSDQSPQGRFDGENSNYGIVDIHHRPYTDVLTRMAAANKDLMGIHATTTRSAPDALPDPPGAIFEPGQYPDRPASIDLLAVEAAGAPIVFNADDARISVAAATPGLNLEFETGVAWGCGLTLLGPAQWKVTPAPAGTTNIDGYTRLVIECDSDVAAPLLVVLDEGGSASPNEPTYDRSGGDDGESFAFAPVTLIKGSNTIRFELEHLVPRGVWGNQLGARRIDLRSVKGFGLVFTPGPSPGRVHLKSVRLEK